MTAALFTSLNVRTYVYVHVVSTAYVRARVQNVDLKLLALTLPKRGRRFVAVH